MKIKSLIRSIIIVLIIIIILAKTTTKTKAIIKIIYKLKLRIQKIKIIFMIYQILSWYLFIQGCKPKKMIKKNLLLSLIYNFKKVLLIKRTWKIKLISKVKKKKNQHNYYRTKNLSKTCCPILIKSWNKCKTKY